MPGLGNLAHRAHEVLLGEEFAGLYAEVAAHHLLIKAVVAGDCYLVDASLRTLHHAQLQVYGVAVDVLLDGHDVEEEIALVHVGRRYGILVLCQTLVEVFLIVHIARLHVEEVVELVCVVDGVAHPGDVGEIIAVTLLKGDEHINLVFVPRRHGVFQNLGVAVAQFVVFLNYALKVVAVVLLYELFLREYFPEVAPFVGLFDYPLEFRVGKHFVAVDIDFMHLHLGVLVNVDGHNHLVLFREVIVEGDFHIGVAEAFCLEVFFGDIGGAVHDVLRNLVAGH